VWNWVCVLDERSIAEKFRYLVPHLDERRIRLVAAAEAIALGYGGIAVVARATGLAVSRISRGIEELRSDEVLEVGRVRRSGAGRKRLVEQDPKLVVRLDRLVDEDSRGDPESPLRWTLKSVRALAAELRAVGHQVCASSLVPLLGTLGFSLQSNRKVREGRQHPDRDAQFRYINTITRAALDAHQPMLSIDTKKKELVGDFKNGGREWRRKGSPERVRTHDFKDKELGKAIPHGIYDVGADHGWITVGVDRDTSQFAVNSIRRWWHKLGKPRYPDARTLTITADCGGSNGNRTKLWKAELQKLADEIGCAIQVLHFPPGTSKWNRIEHRLFSFVTINWRGKPLYSLQTIINLIAATTTKSGLKVHAELDEGSYPAKIKVTNAEIAALNLRGHDFHPEWNYTIAPRAPQSPPTAGERQPAAVAAA
jgi:hypothetical protein